MLRIIRFADFFRSNQYVGALHEKPDEVDFAFKQVSQHRQNPAFGHGIANAGSSSGDRGVSYEFSCSDFFYSDESRYGVDAVSVDIQRFEFKRGITRISAARDRYLSRLAECALAER
jgi:hypothetical protein